MGMVENLVGVVRNPVGVVENLVGVVKNQVGVGENRPGVVKPWSERWKTRSEGHKPDPKAPHQLACGAQLDETHTS